MNETPRQTEKSNRCVGCFNRSEKVQPISDINISQNTNKNIVLSEKNRYYLIDGIVGIYNINNGIYTYILLIFFYF